ncbi:MAG: hypothetical protein KDH91_21930 [Rhodoferax sp.]|nr:hypothetical protein [Rhodoferax sp.]
MPRHGTSDACAAASQHRWRRPLQCGLLTLVIAFPAVAQPITLAQLLRMPIEELLRLEISAPPALPSSRHSASSAPPTAIERGPT